jgi:hypothetical protein
VRRRPRSPRTTGPGRPMRANAEHCTVALPLGRA